MATTNEFEAKLAEAANLQAALVSKVSEYKGLEAQLIATLEARAALRAAYEAARGELADMSMSSQIDGAWAIQRAKAHGINIGSESVDIDAIMRGELL